MDTTLATAPREKVMTVIYEAIDQVNEQAFGSTCLQKEPDTPLYGVLDSLGFVNLIASVEELCERRLGSVISLSDAADGKPENPFRTVSTLCDLILDCLSRRH